MTRQMELEKVIQEVLNRLTGENDDLCVPIGVSNRHIHLSQQDVETLFGEGYELTKLKDLKQPGQFAAKETLTLIGRKGIIQNVRILGPARNKTQVEVSMTDSFTLGIPVPVRESGKTDGTPGVVLKGPKGIVEMKQGVIVALRHIHMPPEIAAKHGLQDKEFVSVEVGDTRKLVYDQVLLRVSDKFVLEMHLDTDEANAAGIKTGDLGKVVKGSPSHEF